MARTITKILILISSFIFLLVVLVFVVRGVVYKNEPDPIEQAVSQTLGNENLILGSTLKLWVDTLGRPDFILTAGSIVKVTQFYWSDYGVGVQIDGESGSDLDSALNKRVSVIIIPLTKKIFPEYLQDTRIIYPDGINAPTVKFAKLLDFKIDNLNINNITERELNRYYENFDASEDFYYHMPIPFNKVNITVWRRNGGCGGPRCEDKIFGIEIGNADMFDIPNLLSGFRRIFIFSKYIFFDQRQ